MYDIIFLSSELLVYESKRSSMIYCGFHGTLKYTVQTNP